MGGGGGGGRGQTGGKGEREEPRGWVGGGVECIVWVGTLAGGRRRLGGTGVKRDWERGSGGERGVWVGALWEEGKTRVIFLGVCRCTPYGGVVCIL